MPAERTAPWHCGADATFVADRIISHLAEKAAVMCKVLPFIRIITVNKAGKFFVEDFLHDFGRNNMLIERGPCDFDVSTCVNQIFLVRGKRIHKASCFSRQACRILILC